MNQPQQPTSGEPLDVAFAELAKYDRGSGRAALLPIDEAVSAAGNDTRRRRILQERLLRTLGCSLSPSAREYAISKLALVGDADCSIALAPHLLQPPVDTAMRTTLETIPGPKATKALLALLPHSSGDQKLGVIASLGVRHDADAVRALASLLSDSDPKVVSAALAALSQAGTRSAGKALKAFVPPSKKLRKVHADAVLTCADHLLGEGSKSDAQDLYALLNTEPYPAFVRTAATRGLKACT